MATTEHPTVEQLLALASHLDRADQWRLLDALIQLQHEQPGGQNRVSITALRGLGRDMWNGVEAQEYVDRERQTWGG